MNFLLTARADGCGGSWGAAAARDSSPGSRTSHAINPRAGDTSLDSGSSDAAPSSGAHCGSGCGRPATTRDSSPARRAVYRGGRCAADDAGSRCGGHKPRPPSWTPCNLRNGRLAPAIDAQPQTGAFDGANASADNTSIGRGRNDDAPAVAARDRTSLCTCRSLTATSNTAPTPRARERLVVFRASDASFYLRVWRGDAPTDCAQLSARGGHASAGDGTNHVVVGTAEGDRRGPSRRGSGGSLQASMTNPSVGIPGGLESWATSRTAVAAGRTAGAAGRTAVAAGRTAGAAGRTAGAAGRTAGAARRRATARHPRDSRGCGSAKEPRRTNRNTDARPAAATRQASPSARAACRSAPGPPGASRRGAGAGAGPTGARQLWTTIAAATRPASDACHGAHARRTRCTAGTSDGPTRGPTCRNVC